jgi:hypothetical protein
MSEDDTGSGKLAGARRPPRTTCKICWNFVYESDATAWVISPNPGIAHKKCDDDRKK